MQNYLRSYVRMIISESLNETEATKKSDDAPQASSTGSSLSEAEILWELTDATNDKQPFESIAKKAVGLDLEYLGSGTSRTVYGLGGDKVIKIALNVKGIEQNKLEAFAGRDAVVAKIIAKVFDSDDEYYWIVSERLTPITDAADFKEAEDIVGVSWNEVREIFGLSKSAKVTGTVPQGAAARAKSSGSGKASGSAPAGCATGQAFLDAVKELKDRYTDLLPGDIAKIDSWGTTKKGCLVLYDYGITKKVYDKYYRTTKLILSHLSQDNPDVFLNTSCYAKVLQHKIR